MAVCYTNLGGGVQYPPPKFALVDWSKYLSKVCRIGVYSLLWWETEPTKYLVTHSIVLLYYFITMLAQPLQVKVSSSLYLLRIQINIVDNHFSCLYPLPPWYKRFLQRLRIIHLEKRFLIWFILTFELCHCKRNCGNLVQFLRIVTS